MKFWNYSAKTVKKAAGFYRRFVPEHRAAGVPGAAQRKQARFRGCGVGTKFVTFCPGFENILEGNRLFGKAALGEDGSPLR